MNILKRPRRLVDFLYIDIPWQRCIQISSSLAKLLEPFVIVSDNMANHVHVATCAKQATISPSNRKALL
jgi:hypothetical protein